MATQPTARGVAHTIRFLGGETVPHRHIRTCTCIGYTTPKRWLLRGGAEGYVTTVAEGCYKTGNEK